MRYEWQSGTHSSPESGNKAAKAIIAEKEAAVV